MVCPYCGKDSEDSEYCEHCGMRLVPYRKGTAQAKRTAQSPPQQNDKADNTDTFVGRYKARFVKNTTWYSGLLWAVLGFFALTLSESRPVAILASGFSLVKCIWYMVKHEKKWALSIIGIAVDAFCIYLYVWYYLIRAR